MSRFYNKDIVPEEGHCERCNEKLDRKKSVMLCLNSSTGEYSTTDWPDEVNQGWFEFGSACAKQALKGK